MPQRFYFDDNTYWDLGTSNPSTPAYHAAWHETNSALRVRLLRDKPGNAFSQTTIQKNVAGAPKNGLARVYVSEPIQEAFTLSGTVKGQVLCQEQQAANDEMRAIIIRAWDPVGNIFRSPVILTHIPSALSNEFDNVTTKNRFFPPETAITPCNIRKGDRIVVEVGIAFFTAGSAGVTGLLRTGNPAGTGDLPEDETYTTPELAAWLEFSMNFPSAAVSSLQPLLSTRVSAGFSPGGGLEYLFELLSPTGARYDVTEQISIEGLSRLTLALERNLHEFRAGDASLTLDDGDGFFTQLFQNINPEDRWHLNIDRDRVRHFTGIIPGIDCIRYKKKEALCELTAMDLSKLLEDVSAETVARPANIYALGADIAASNTTITLNSTAGLFNTDKFSVTEDSTSEEFEIALILSSTQVQVTQAAAHAFTAAGATVLLVTPFYRFKTPDFLVNALLDAAGNLINGRVVNASAPFGGTPIFSEMSTQGLPSTAVPSVFLQKAAKHLVRVGLAVFDQVTPDANWLSAGTDRRWVDWSPYRTQAEGEPATFAVEPVGGADPELVGIDFTPGALVGYRVIVNSGTKAQLDIYTSADGITWAGAGSVVLGDYGPLFNMESAGGDYDSVRNRVYYTFTGQLGQEFGYYDIAGAVKVVIDSTDLRSVSGNGNVRYSKEFDGVVVYNSTQKSIEVWRGTNQILSYAGGFANVWSPKQTRYFNGIWYTVGYPSGIPSVLFSDDNFANVQQDILAGAPSSGGTGRHLSIVNGSVRVVVNAAPDSGTVALARYFVAASSAAWTISYADFSGQSVINALDDLAIALNAFFFCDTEGIAHFGPRGMDSGAQLKVLDDLILEQEEEPIWVELYDYVEISLEDGSIVSAGQKTSKSRNLSVKVQFISTQSVASSVVAYLFEFFSKKRRFRTVAVQDDGTVYTPWDPVRIDGTDWLVYTVERDLANYEISLDLIEKVT